MRILILLGILALGILGVIIFIHPLILLIKGILAMGAILLIAVGVISLLERIIPKNRNNQ